MWARGMVAERQKTRHTIWAPQGPVELPSPMLGKGKHAWTHASNIFPWTPFAPCTELHTCSFFPCSKKESLRCGIESNSKLEQRASESILEPQLIFHWQQLAYQERERVGVCMARYCSRKCRVEKWKAIKDAFTDYKNSFRSCIWQMLLG
jgi:hypothetical protein